MSWWPFRRKSGTSKQSNSDGEEGKDKRLDETRRILRHVARAAYFAEDEPEPGPEPEPFSEPETLSAPEQQKPTVTNYGNIVHVNFHKIADVLRQDTILRMDPITRRTRRIARRFDRSDVFYTKDGRLLD